MRWPGSKVPRASNSGDGGAETGVAGWTEVSSIGVGNGVEYCSGESESRGVGLEGGWEEVGRW